MANDKVTSLDVARKAGVSQSAVSRVFTPGASASQKTVEKVKLAVDELGYRPNILARSLITGKSRIIGLVVAYLDNQFYPEALEKLSNRFQKEGYQVLVFMSANTVTDISNVIEGILEYQVDGIVAASVAMSSDLARRCEAAGVPIVLFNRSQADEKLSSVTCDNFTGGKLVAEHLLELGHNRIGHIAGWEGASTQLDREAGFNKVLMKNGITGYSRELGNFHVDQAKIAARKMFSCKNFPSAVFISSDHMAFAVMDILRFELGLRIPEDVSVVGFDDVPLASYAAYNLTTIRQDANEMVDAAVNILLDQINYPRKLQNNSIRVEAKLIDRASTSKSN